MNKTHKALIYLRPNCEWYQVGDDLEGIVWVKPENTTTPTQAEIEDAIKEIESQELLAAEQAASNKAAVLSKIGLTADEVAALLG